MDYKSIFRDRVIIITGCGRSGTTILGKIIGSMEPAYYLFEPSVMKYVTDPWELRATIFEDYWLLQVQGRNLNINKKDDSYYGNYRTEWVRPLGRYDDIDECRKSNLVIKLTEYQDRLGFLNKTFPGVKAIHIYRNGNDVVDSMVKRGWYTDDYMMNGFLDITAVGMPCFLTGVGSMGWSDYNQITRCAAVWRSTTEAGLKGDMLNIKYEHLYNYDFESIAQWSGMRITPKTNQHIESIRKPAAHKDITGDIQEPEKSRFMTLMNRLEYV